MSNYTLDLDISRQSQKHNKNWRWRWSKLKHSMLYSRKEIWIMDPAADQYYRWLTIIAGPVFYNLMMIVTRYHSHQTLCWSSSRKLEANLKNIPTLPFRACFNELQNKYTKLWLVLDYTSDVIYYADSFVRSRTGQDSSFKNRLNIQKPVLVPREFSIFSCFVF